MKTAHEILSEHLPDGTITQEMVLAAEEFARQEITRTLQILQTQVHKITGDGEVMKLFNGLLGVCAS